ncbi:MAG TPA: hypothetical protein VFT99_08980, partial [Roseiflexaceae bacterium]|nr:hypothetical protein [Roseiflexaceae bacterium]
HSHFRNTGDDALASWAPAGQGEANTGNVMRFNTVQVPWRANCYAIYGGSDNRIEDSVCADVVTYPGILLAQQFKSWPFGGTTAVERVTLLRAGGSMWGQQHGALKILALEGALSGIHIADVQIDSPTFAGIQIQGPLDVSNISVEQVTIDGPGTHGIEITGDARGAASFSAVTVMNAGRDGLRNAAPAQTFEVRDAGGNQGWNAGA